MEENFPAALNVNPSQAGAPEKLKGPQANSDPGCTARITRPMRRVGGGPLSA